ncbi:MAG: hypothetical protein JJE25_07320 [Bacteroidia bacterium]|nr:hypothetical protein [Bacteroidia bacterium]
MLSFKNIFLLSCFVLFYFDCNAKEADTLSVKFGLRYSFSTSIRADGNWAYAPYSIEVLWYHKNFTLYGGPKIYQKSNEDNNYNSKVQSFQHRIGFSVGIEYSFIKARTMLTAFYHFQYNYRTTDGYYYSDSILNDNYYSEHLLGVGTGHKIGNHFYWLIKYGMGDIHWITVYNDYAFPNGSNRIIKDQLDYYVGISFGYDFH